ncbi:hypothetical protein SM033_00211 [Vibrio phage vB_VpaM_sm033]|nr:hypothetical protein SM033_00211 [Vibrio phage vB_VpaM_sm033]
MKVSNLDRAKILQAWSKALQSDKVSEWARNELPTKLKEYMESVEPKFVLKRSGQEFILLGLAKVYNDGVDVMVYDIAEGCTEVFNIFADVEDAYELTIHEKADEDKYSWCNQMSVPFTGLMLGFDEENVLHAFKFNGSGE